MEDLKEPELDVWMDEFMEEQSSPYCLTPMPWIEWIQWREIYEREYELTCYPEGCSNWGDWIDLQIRWYKRTLSDWY
jgi:hypothetical protein